MLRNVLGHILQPFRAFFRSAYAECPCCCRRNYVNMYGTIECWHCGRSMLLCPPSEPQCCNERPKAQPPDRVQEPIPQPPVRDPEPFPQPPSRKPEPIPRPLSIEWLASRLANEFPTEIYPGSASITRDEVIDYLLALPKSELDELCALGIRHEGPLPMLVLTRVLLELRPLDSKSLARIDTTTPLGTYTNSSGSSELRREPRFELPRTDTESKGAGFGSG